MAPRPRRIKNPSQVNQARQRVTSRPAEVGLERIRTALCEPSRLRIIQALSAVSLCVDDLANVIERAPAATSQHLRVLRSLGLVVGTRRGTTVYYELNAGPTTTHLEAVLQAMESDAAR